MEVSANIRLSPSHLSSSPVRASAQGVFFLDQIEMACYAFLSGEPHEPFNFKEYAMTQTDHLNDFSSAISAFTRSDDRRAFLQQTLTEKQGDELAEVRKNIAVIYMQRSGAMIGIDHIVALPVHIFSDEDIHSLLTETVPSVFPQHRNLLINAIPALGRNRKAAFQLLCANPNFRAQFADIIMPVERRVSATEALHHSA